jgi:hypothetical protein
MIGVVALSMLVVADVREEARLAFEAGLAALDAGDAARAVESFERSLALRESAPALYNLGLAHRKLENRILAVEALERFLARAPGSAKAPRARELIRELRTRLGRVAVDARGGADEVTIDGRPTVARVLDVEPGAHVVRVVKRGHQPEEATVTVEAGSTATVAIDAARRPLRGSIIVGTDQARAEIAIDHRIVGHGSSETSIEAGAHWVDVAADGFIPARRRVFLEPGATERIDVALVPVPEDPLTSKWWFWTAIGVGVAAAAGGTAAAVVLGRPEPDGGTTGAVFFDD